MYIRKLCIAMMFVAFTLTVKAQTFTSSQVKGCKWIDDVSRERVVNTIWFTDSLRYSKNDYLRINKSSLLTAPYYLADEIPCVFDESKVGEETSGKYLVMKEGTAKYGYVISVKEILCISEDKLVLKYGVYRSNTDNPPTAVFVFRKDK